MSHGLREAAAAFRRSPLLTGLSAAMVGLALFVVGLFSLAAYNLQLALRTMEERVEVVAYLREGTRLQEVEEVRSALEALPPVRFVRYVNKQQALERAIRDLPEIGEISSDFEANPFPASLEVELREGSRSTENVERIVHEARLYGAVEDVRYGQEWVEKLFFLRRIGGITSLVLGSAFAVVAALIIATAVRIAVFARKEEIYVMQLVGARDGFIRRPFLIEGFFTGLAGGLLAYGLTWSTYTAVYRLLFELEWVPREWVGIGILAGALFGVTASGLSVRRHLREV